MIELIKKPIQISNDRFTPVTRTPWAGTQIRELFKENVTSNRQTRIGESWEFSCDPSFPSLVNGNDRLTLIDLIEKYPHEILSPKLANTSTNAEILVKLLNADSPLSLQVHPTDHDNCLDDDECGKPESWLVLHALPGSGIYIGFVEGIDEDEFKDSLRLGEDLRRYLQFVEVSPGDYFEIEPGTPHAIGPGVTLLEPQRILAGKSGKTFRLWDWGRKYDQEGNLSPEGQPRKLHIEESLAIIDFEQNSGARLLNRVYKKPELQKLSTSEVFTYPANPFYQVRLLNLEESQVHMAIEDGYGVMIPVGGVTTISNVFGRMDVLKGESILLPHSCMPVDCQGGSFCLVTPSCASISIEKKIDFDRIAGMN